MKSKEIYMAHSLSPQNLIKQARSLSLQNFIKQAHSLSLQNFIKHTSWKIGQGIVVNYENKENVWL